MRYLALFTLVFLTSLPTRAVQPPLHAYGPYLLDNNGDRVKLKSVNWYGPHLEKQVVEGLDKQPLSHIVNLIQTAGFNSVRLPFSNQMLRDSSPPLDSKSYFVTGSLAITFTLP